MWRRRRAWIVCGLIAVPCAYVASIAATWPAVRALGTHDPADTSFMRQRAHDTGRAQPALRFTALEEMSSAFVCAVVKSEDRTFFRHRGFDFEQLHKAATRALHGHAGMGGSTITQQLARNLFLDAERSYRRKLREAGLTVELEASLEKRRILELYLNSAEWGDDVWGVTAAAQHYFGKPPRALDLIESTLLASLLPAPRRALSGDNLARAHVVAARILHQLWMSGVIDAAGYEEADDRAQRLFAALAAGAPLAQAMAAAPAPGAHAAAPTATASVGTVIASECGLDRELQEFERFRRSQAEVVGQAQLQRR